MIEGPALLIVDMQRDYLDVGAPIEVARGRAMIPRLELLLKKCRKASIPIFHIITTRRRNKTDWTIFDLSGRKPPHCIEGTEGAEIVRQLKPEDGENIVEKKRYSGFFGTDLDLLLRILNIKTLILTGVATECCVRSTAFDGYFRNYNIVIVEDCTESRTKKTKDFSLSEMKRLVGDVMKLGKLLPELFGSAT